MQSDLERRVKEIIAEVYTASRERSFGWEDVATDLPLYSFDEEEGSLGLDSLDAVEIATALEEAFDVVLPAEIDPADLRTAGHVVRALELLLREQR